MGLFAIYPLKTCRFYLLLFLLFDHSNKRYPLYCLRQNQQNCHANSSVEPGDKLLLGLCKLSTLTGFTWIVVVLLLLIQNEVLEYMFILLNASQGLFITIAFAFDSRLVNQ